MENFLRTRPEVRYGAPNADQILVNRQYLIGYSYLYRQARWALELIDPSNSLIDIDDRLDTFRCDVRLPDMFHAELDDYRGMGYDRGHMVSSADRRGSEILNSETFLLSNMSPQAADLNRRHWRLLEEAVRTLAESYVEVYVICGPLFLPGKSFRTIGEKMIAVPHAYYKSVLAENERGRMMLWSFIMPNERTEGKIEDYRVSTTEVEKMAGLVLWPELRTDDVRKLKDQIPEMWE